MEWYYYVLIIAGIGLGLCIVYWFLRSQNIIGGIPIISTVIDPIMFGLSSNWSDNRDRSSNAIDRHIKFSRKPDTWSEINSVNIYELDDMDIQLDYFSVWEAKDLYSGKPSPSKNFRHAPVTNYPFIMLNNDDVYLVKTSGYNNTRYIIRVESAEAYEFRER